MSQSYFISSPSGSAVFFSTRAFGGCLRQVVRQFCAPVASSQSLSGRAGCRVFRFTFGSPAQAHAAAALVRSWFGDCLGYLVVRVSRCSLVVVA